MVSKRAKAAAKAAKRIPIAGAAVALAPLVRAAANAGLSTSTITQASTWSEFLRHIVRQYGAFDTNTGNFLAQEAMATYGPVAAYILARRFAGRHISRALRPLGLRF